MPHARRTFLRLVGGSLAAIPALGAAACTAGGSAKPSPTPMASFPPGPTTAGTNIPRLAEGGQLYRGAARHQVQIVWSIDTKAKAIALTFDDGPDSDVTPDLLDVLDNAGIRATLFMVGARVLANAGMIRGRVDRHEVGNHTQDHKSLFLMDEDATIKDLTAAHQAIAKVVGREPRLFRPPYGHVNGNTLAASGFMGYDIVMWNQYIGDTAYENDGSKLVDDVLKAVTPGSIVLGHAAGDTRLIAIRQLPTIIQELRRMNYAFVTVSELRAMQGK